MRTAKQLWYRLRQWKYLGLCLLVLVTLIMHFSIIMHPGEPIFDEKFYVPDARYVLRGEGTDRIEHPPLGKVLIASGMFLFGDNPLGWRFLSVISGAICLILFYLICRRLDVSAQSSFLAAALLAFENLSFVQSGVAMLDVFSLVLMLASFLLYLKGRYLFSGALAGLSTLAKLSGALTLLVIILHWLFTGRKHWKRLMVFAASAPASFFLLLPLFDFFIWRRFTNPIGEIKTMLNVTVDATYSLYYTEIMSRPWEWILQPKMIAYWKNPHYLGTISPTIWIAIVPAACFLIYRSIKGNRAAIFSLAWFAGTYLIWIPVSLILDRQSYVYYFYPTVGSVCIGLALMLSCVSEAGHDRLRRILQLLIPCYLLVHLAFFIYLAPVSPWLKVASSIAAYVFARYLPGSRVIPSAKESA
ncbi:MAG: glycosyltransferase family 39 protein [Chloroflexota bacterium]